MASLYMASSLFNAGERLHNLYLERFLKKFGHNLILPQREALKFFKEGMFDTAGIVSDCQRHVADKNNLCVCCADGADADSGMAIEFGIAIAASGRAIVYRTDFRTDLKREIGINAMFHAGGSILVYEPCFFTELQEVEPYYRSLALKIHQAVLLLTK